MNKNEGMEAFEAISKRSTYKIVDPKTSIAHSKVEYLLSWSEVCSQSKQVIGGSNKRAQPPFINTKWLQVIIPLFGIKLSQFCLHLHEQV